MGQTVRLRQARKILRRSHQEYLAGRPSPYRHGVTDRASKHVRRRWKRHAYRLANRRWGPHKLTPFGVSDYVYQTRRGEALSLKT